MKKIFNLLLLFALLPAACRDDNPGPIVSTALKVTSVWPSGGEGNIIVTINGKNFSSTVSENKVTFAGKPGTVIEASSTQLLAVTPEEVTTGVVSVTVNGQAADGPVFTYQKSTSVTSDYIVTTFAGDGTAGYKEGAGDGAQFKGPEGVAIDHGGNLIIADKGNNVIRKITPAGVVSTLAGDGTAGYADGSGTAAKFSGPWKVAIDNDNNVIVADRDNFKIRKVTPAGEVSTIAGSVAGTQDGVGAGAQFMQPLDVAVDKLGNIYVADNTAHRIRKVTPTGTVTTLAGSTAGAKDGTGAAAQFKNPSGLTVDGEGNVIVADRINNRIRKVTPDGAVTTVAGTGVAGGQDGNAAEATFNNPYGVAVDKNGNILVVDLAGARLRKITPEGVVSTLAGSAAGYADGLSAGAKFNQPTDLDVDADGNIYITDLTNNRIRKVRPVK